MLETPRIPPCHITSTATFPVAAASSVPGSLQTALPAAVLASQGHLGGARHPELALCCLPQRRPGPYRVLRSSFRAPCELHSHLSLCFPASPILILASLVSTNTLLMLLPQDPCSCCSFSPEHFLPSYPSLTSFRPGLRRHHLRWHPAIPCPPFVLSYSLLGMHHQPTTCY